MALLLVVHLVLVAGYAGFQWTVQVLVYRQFALVPPASFVGYERAHQRRISYLVGPLFGGLVLGTAAVLVVRPLHTPLWAAVLSAAMLAVVLAATAFRAVPLHGRLASGWDGAAFSALLRVDLLRALVATANVLLAGWMVLRALPS